MSFVRSMATAAAAAALLMSAANGVAQTYVVHRIGQSSSKGYDDIHVSKAASPGQQIKIWWATLINPDCSAAGTITTEILSPPRHGQAEISSEPLYPNFIAPNPRSACNVRKVPGRQAFYTAEPDFHGHDKVVIRSATSEGRVRRIIVDIDVL